MVSLTYLEHRDRHASRAAKRYHANLLHQRQTALEALERCYLDFRADLGYIPGHPKPRHRKAYAAWLQQANVVAMTAEVARLDKLLGEGE